MKLFAIYIGGRVAGMHTEQHDMRFVVAETIEDTYAALRNQWRGIAKSLHIDCWSALTQADGYRIHLEKTPPLDKNKLFYVHLGGYDKTEFTELHRNLFIVADTETVAKTKALRSLTGWSASHKDALYEAEACIALDTVISDCRWYIHLEKIEDGSPAPSVCKYIPVN